MRSFFALLVLSAATSSAFAATTYKFCDPENHMYTTMENDNSAVKIKMVNTDDNDSIDLEFTLVQEGANTAPKNLEVMGAQMNDQVTEITYYSLTSEESGDAIAFIAKGSDNNLGLALHNDEGTEFLGTTKSCNE